MLHNPSIDLSDRSSEFLDEVGPPEFSNVLAMCYTIINGSFVDRR